MPKPKLPRDCVITLSGDFGENRRPAQYADWVQKAGARLQTSLTDDTTHFIVSDEHWSAQKPMVRQALKKKGLHILKQDWLDGVLQGRNLNAKSYDLRQQRIPALLAVSKGEAVAVKGSAPRSRKRKLVDEAPAIKRPRKNTAAAALFDETQRYLPKNAKAKKASEKPKTGLLAKSVINKSVQAAVEHYDRGSKMAKADHVSENNHIYVDQEGFVYEIILSKVQMEFNINQSVVLKQKIFESDYDPHVYTMVEHDRGGALMEAKAPHHYATGTNFATAYRALKTRFNHHTGRSWDERDQFPHKRQRPPAMHTAAGAPSTKAARRPLLAAPSKTISEAQIEVFQAQPYEYRNPPIDQPQGVTGPTPSPNALQGQLSFGQPEEAQSTFGGADDADIMDGGDTGMQQE